MHQFHFFQSLKREKEFIPCICKGTRTDYFLVQDGILYPPNYLVDLESVETVYSVIVLVLAFD